MDVTAPPCKRQKAEPRPKPKPRPRPRPNPTVDVVGPRQISSSSSSAREEPKLTSSTPLHTPPPAIKLIKVIPPRDLSRTPTFDQTNAEGKYAVYWMERAFRAEDTYNTLKRKTDVKINELFREKAEEMSREKKGYEDQLVKSKMEMEEMKRSCEADKESFARENTKLSEENKDLIGRNDILTSEKQKIEDKYKAHRYVASEDSKRAKKLEDSLRESRAEGLAIFEQLAESSVRVKTLEKELQASEERNRKHEELNRHVEESRRQKMEELGIEF